MRNVCNEIGLIYMNLKASANVIFYDDHGKTEYDFWFSFQVIAIIHICFINSLAKAKECAKKIFFKEIGLKNTDILRFVDIETLQISYYGDADSKLTKDERTMVKNLQSFVKEDARD